MQLKMLSNQGKEEGEDHMEKAYLGNVDQITLQLSQHKYRWITGENVDSNGMLVSGKEPGKNDFIYTLEV